MLSSRQLVGFGLSTRCIRLYTDSGRLHRIHHGVYSLVPEPLLTANGRRMAAVLACGPGAALSHYSAARHRSLIDVSRARIDVTVPTRGGRARQGIHIHRSGGLRKQDIELVHGIPTTTVARTIFDLADTERFTARQLERLLDEAAFLEVLDAAALIEQIEHRRGRPRACGRLTKALADHQAGSTRTDGPIGEAALVLIRATPGLPGPKVQYPIDLHDGGPMITADFAWPTAKLILETDGDQAHAKPRRRRADYLRDQRAARAGWHTVRADWQQVHTERGRLGQTLLELVRTRSASAAEPAEPAEPAETPAATRSSRSRLTSR